MYFWKDTSLSTQEIAKKLLGCLLVKENAQGRTSGFIVETEAYLGELDQAAHTFQLRRTPRVESMYDAPGTIYVYTMHTHDLVNLVVQEVGIPEAILIRAVEPYEGIELMETRRQRPTVELTNGPGKLTKALGIYQSDNGKDIASSPLFLDLMENKQPADILETPRIGIPNKGDWTEAPLRYIVKGNPFVSKMKKKYLDENNGWLK